MGSRPAITAAVAGVAASLAVALAAPGPAASTSTGRVAAADEVAAFRAAAASPAGGVPLGGLAVPRRPPGPDLVAEAAAARARADALRPRRATLAVTGDVLLHLPVVEAAATAAGHDFAPMLAGIARRTAGADLALCHLEVPLSADGSDLSGYPVFQGPPGIAPALAGAGYDGCSVASNHALDKGPRGVATTLDVLDAAGLGHAGTARSAAEDAAPVLFRAGSLTVGHVSATYGLNGFRMPAGQPWLVDLADSPESVAQLVAEAAAARAAGADVVVASLHWGDEYRTEPSTAQREVAAALAASPDVDLVVGHHAHVVQPVERVGDTVVVFGLGNLLSGQGGRHTAGTQDGVVVEVTVEVPAGGGPAAVVDVAHTPTWVEPGTYRVLEVPAALADPALPAGRRRELEASLARTTDAIGPLARPGDREPARIGPGRAGIPPAWHSR